MQKSAIELQNDSAGELLRIYLDDMNEKEKSNPVQMVFAYLSVIMIKQNIIQKEIDELKILLKEKKNMNKYDSMSFDELRALMVERGFLEVKK